MARSSKTAHVFIGKHKTPVGLLRFESDGRRQSSAFEYATSWLDSPHGFDISPSLPRREGAFYASGNRENMRTALPGVVSDATPDGWGRSLMQASLGRGLTEFDYLTLSDDRTRQGALRYLDENGEQMVSADRPLSRRNISLERLRSLALTYDRDPVRAQAEAAELTGAVGSLGGARPKANVISDDGLYIAKFTSERDGRPIERVEVATLNLARDAGTHASDAELMLGNSDHPVAMIRRFDRRADVRIPYMSIRTALDDAEAGTYDQIAEVIRRVSSDPRADLDELFGRVAFTILVSNCDDHIKNHGFLYTGENRWVLSPAFDVNPQPERHRALETPISELSGHEASIEALIEAAPFFDMTEDEGLAVADRVGTAIRENWRGRFEEQGVTGEALRIYQPAFENPEMTVLSNLSATKSVTVTSPFSDDEPDETPDHET